MALVIAGERSGVGKTTVTLALLAALRQRQRSVQSFKVGPDYIDPMFHQYVTGKPCYTLDPVLTSEAYVRCCYAQHVTDDASDVLIEGVMGLFDGARGADDWASTAHIARLLDLPILLVLDCSRLSRSIAAIVHGYRSFDPRLTFAGLILNRVGSDRHLELLKTALEPLNLPILGVLHRHDEITLPDRHLGLVPTAELTDLNKRLDRLAHLANTCFDWSALLPLLAAKSGNPTVRDAEHPWSSLKSDLTSPIRLAVAHDRAFSFYYPDNLELLAQLGAELVFWSPLHDAALPEQVQGLYFGGGFPEVFAAELADNRSAQRSVRSAVQAGIPTYAECGGLMYLAKHLIDFQEQPWNMVNVLPTVATMGKRLTLGYRQATALQDALLMPAGTTVWGHEFHRSHLSVSAAAPLYQIQNSGAPVMEGWWMPSVQASYVHLHWGDRPELPGRFLKWCHRFAQAQL